MVGKYRFELRGDTHMTSTFRGREMGLGVVGRGKNEILSDVEGWGVSKCSGRPIFIFFVKEDWICAVTRHHAEPHIGIFF